MPLSETASRPEHRIRNVVSACGLVRKACSTLSAHSGVQFPPETPPGKHIPVWSRNLGCSFRLKGDPESTSHSEWQFPGHSFRRYKATVRHPYHMPSNMRSRNTKQQIECSFSKSTRPETYQDFISSYRSRSPITAHRFKQEICRQKQVITCMVRFRSALVS